MEEKLKNLFNTNNVVKRKNTFGGDISQASVYLVDEKPIFIKTNDNKNARLVCSTIFSINFLNASKIFTILFVFSCPLFVDFILSEFMLI